MGLRHDIQVDHPIEPILAAHLDGADWFESRHWEGMRHQTGSGLQTPQARREPFKYVRQQEEKDDRCVLRFRLKHIAATHRDPPVEPLVTRSAARFADPLRINVDADRPRSAARGRQQQSAITAAQIVHDILRPNLRQS